MEENIRRRELLKNELTECANDCGNSSLHLVYQPIVGTHNGELYGLEALARFDSEAYGPISPLEFIPIAEETRLIVPLGQKIMHNAFGFQKRLADQGYDDIVMSVNVSAIQLLRDDFLPDLSTALEESGIRPELVMIEITESYFTEDFDGINEKLRKIKGLGVRVALDDFGIGYSSLARERELNVNCLKVDKYFIDKLLVVGENETITSDIISMAHKLGHRVVAEGVEKEIQRQYLKNHHCDYMQGYYFSRPIPPDEVLRYLREHPHGTGMQDVV